MDDVWDDKFEGGKMSEKQETPKIKSTELGRLPRWIFMSRWLQAPLYIGLIVAQGL